MKKPKPLKAKAKTAKPKGQTKAKKPVKKKRVSKVKTYTATQKNNLCAKVFLLMAGGRSVRSIFEDDKPVEFPHLKTFQRWIDEDKDKRTQYAHATRARHDHIFEEMLNIADDATNDFSINKNTGESVLNTEHVQRSKLRIETRKWMLGKMDSTKYGDKTIHEGNEDAPFTIVHLGGPKVEKP